MGVKFLDGYISFCEGEKDPRNLVLIFAIDRVILIEFNISERVQVSDLVHHKYTFSDRMIVTL